MVAMSQSNFQLVSDEHCEHGITIMKLQTSDSDAANEVGEGRLQQQMMGISRLLNINKKLRHQPKRVKPLTIA